MHISSQLSRKKRGMTFRCIFYLFTPLLYFSQAMQRLFLCCYIKY
ncbi:hypothetical protein BACCOP_03597 [Phocaeicola coprocola DSM 17136]|uniref:Uncharacterized protein n=1 Tax=Phocaeicola coprocola DSM 17136 TaxID=470145 RepID=B3JNT1_9BACT|nr:hypothetical protein BACCOP_03597 [Phocaeicola coprocola DSM 17136]